MVSHFHSPVTSFPSHESVKPQSLRGVKDSPFAFGSLRIFNKALPGNRSSRRNSGQSPIQSIVGHFVPSSSLN